VVFQRTYGGENWDHGSSVRQTTDGGYVTVGRTDSYGAGENDVWLVRTDALGDTMWTRTYGGENSDRGHSVQQTADSGYVLAGYTNSFGAGSYDIWLIRTDASGDTLWTRTYGDTLLEDGFSVRETADGGYIIVGSTQSYGAGESDIWLIKTDASGDTLWTRTYGDTGLEFGHSVQQTADGGYVIVGGTESHGAGDFDVRLVRADALGDTMWTRTYGGENSDYGYSVAQTMDGGYIVAGFTKSFGAGNEDVWLLKTDSMGDTAWTRTFGDSARNLGYSVDVTADSGYVIVGFTGLADPDCWLIKTDGDGGTMWTRIFGGLADDVGSSVEQTADGGYIIGGYTMSFGAGWYDFWLIKTDTAGLLAVEEPGTPDTRRVESATILSGTMRYQATAGSSRQSAELVDLSGRKVVDLKPGENDISRLSPGVYFVREEGPRGQGSEGPSVRKVVIQR